jgi:predicted RNase H-like nuclease (RuvC/YqgF family)
MARPPAIAKLEARIDYLERENRDLAQKLEYKQETLDAYRNSDKTLRSELDRTLARLKDAEQAQFDVYRLEGVLEGLERAGKVDKQI